MFKFVYRLFDRKNISRNRRKKMEEKIDILEQLYYDSEAVDLNRIRNDLKDVINRFNDMRRND